MDRRYSGMAALIMALLLACMPFLTATAIGEETKIIPIREGIQEAGSEEESIPLWSADSPAMRSIISYVQEITDETSEKYVPAE